LTDLLAAELYERLSRRFGETVLIDLDTDGELVQLSLYPLGWDSDVCLIFADLVVLCVGEHVHLEYYSGDTARDSDDLFDTIVDIARQGVYAYRKRWGIAAGFGPPPPGTKVLQYNAGWETEDTGENS